MAENPYLAARRKEEASSAQPENPYLAARRKKQERNGMAEDLIKSLTSGVASGVAGVVSTPVLIEKLAKLGGSMAYDFVSGDDTSEWRAEQSADLDNDLLSYGTVKGAIDSLSDYVGLGEYTDYDPQSTMGDYTQTFGEFVPGMGRSQIARMALPGAIVSETAGQATEGTPLEPVARTAGALLGGSAIPTIVGAPASRYVARNTPEMSDDQWTEMADLLQRGQDAGLPLTVPEAAAQVAGPSRLNQMQQVVETNPKSASKMTPFMNERSQQQRTASSNMLDMVAPPIRSNSELGTTVQREAGNAINNVRAGINDQTAPIYGGVANNTLENIDEVMAIPGVQSTIAELRQHPVLGQRLEGVEDNSYEMLDAVRQRMRNRGDDPDLNNSDPQAAAANKHGAMLLRRALREDPDYSEALDQQATYRQEVLDPISAGPLGQMAGTSDTAVQGQALLPRQPRPGQTDDIVEAIQSVGQQSVGTTPMRDLARSELETSAMQSMARRPGGPDGFEGPEWAASIAGNPAQRENLQNVLRETAGEGPQTDFFNTLQLLEAQGNRLPPGTNAPFNQQVKQDMAAQGRLGQAAEIAAGPTRLLSNPANAVKTFRENRNAKNIADVLLDTSPEAMMKLRELQSATNFGPMAAAMLLSARPIATQE